MDKLNKEQVERVDHFFYYKYGIKVDLEKFFKISINALNKGGETALFISVTEGLFEISQLLLEQSADSNAPNKDGRVPLHAVCNNLNVDAEQFLSLLIKFSANPNTADKNFDAPVHVLVSAKAGNDSSGLRSKILISLVENKANINLPNKNGDTPLHLAAKNGHDYLIDVMIAQGGDITIKNKDGHLPLHTATMAKQTLCVEKLLKYPIDINTQDKNGNTALLHAIAGGDKGTAKLLLKHRADPNLRNQKRSYPLLLAAASGDNELVTLLLKYNANANISPGDEESPLAAAAKKGHAEVVLSLLNAGALVNVALKNNDTALHVASAKGHQDVVSLLLQFKADPNTQNAHEETALHVAAAKNSLDVILLLLQYNANFSIQDKDGCTPLMRAVKQPKGATDKEVVSLFLNAGADPNLKAKDGSTVKQYITDGAIERLLKNRPSQMAGLKNLIDKGQFEVAIAVLFYGKSQNSASLVKELSKITNPAKNPFATVHPKESTVLHYAIQKKLEYIKIKGILDAYSGAANIQTRNMFPLDVALQNKMPLDLIADLIEAMSIPSIKTFSHATSKGKKHDGDFNYTNEELQLLRSSLQRTQEELTCVHIHLCGDGCAGKTTTRIALKQTIKKKTMANLFGLASKTVEDIPVGLEGRTVGQEQSVVKAGNNMEFVLHDYGGQDEFHVNHSRFLSMAGSIYVIVVPLWNIAENREYTLEQIVTRYQYWLQFLNTIASDIHSAACVTVVNFPKHVTQQQLVDVVAKLENIQEDWRSCDSRHHTSVVKLQFVGHPLVTDLKVIGQVRITLYDTLINDALAVIGAPNINVTELFNYIISRKNAEGTKWPAVIPFRALHNEYLRAALLELNKADADGHIAGISERVVQFLCGRIETQLINTGEIVIIEDNASCDKDNAWVVTDVEWLTKTILGLIVKKVNHSTQLDSHLMSSAQIDELTEGASKYFGNNKESIPRLLSTIGLCIADETAESGGSGCASPVPMLSPCSGGGKMWFPIFTRKKASEEDYKLMDIATNCHTANSRCVIRRFELLDAQKQMFPPGYFSKLFVDVAGMEKVRKQIRIFDDALIIHRDYTDGESSANKIQIIIKSNLAEGSFDVRICTKTSRQDMSRPSYAWKMMNKIRDLLVAPKANSWLHHVQLKELFVDPTTYFDSNPDYKAVLSEEELYAFLNHPDPDVQANYKSYFYGVNGGMFAEDERMPKHDILSQLYHMQRQLQRIEGKIDEGFEELKGTLLNTLHSFYHNVTSSVHMLTEHMLIHATDSEGSFEVLDHVQTLSDRLEGTVSHVRTANNSEELQQMIHNEMQAAMKEFMGQATAAVQANLDVKIHENILQQQEKILAEIRNLHVIDRVSDVPADESLTSMKEILTQKLNGLKHDLQTSITHELSSLHQEILEMKDMLGIQSNILRTLLSDKHHVPTLMLILPKEPITMLSKLKGMFSRSVELYFICPITLKKGNKYELTLPRDWVVDAAPFIKISLIVFKIALLAMGLPIPIPPLPIDITSCTYLNCFSSNLQEEVANVCNMKEDRVKDGLNDTLNKSLHDTLKHANNESSIGPHHGSALQTSALQSIVEELKPSSYEAIYNLLHDTLEKTTNPHREGWEPMHTGLVKVTSKCDGATAWILKNEVTIQAFHAKGQDAFVIKV